MALIETFHLSHLPSSYAVHAALYRDVQNASFLRQQLLSGNTEFEYAFLDATSIISTMHALAAAFRATNDFMNNRLRSRNVHSETVFCLSPNNNIADSFRRFGVNDTTTNLLVIKICTGGEITTDGVRTHLSRAVDGAAVPFIDESLRSMTDLAKIKKIYKIGTSNNVGSAGKRNKSDISPTGSQMVLNGNQAELKERKELEVAILGLMALRGAT
ncbi:CGI-121-domain-containing protein [Xylona heveae TC161]|uniref:EKC/KEOPS complex subunit CGI121 n=1 Tax=Xylona heveae (strain CBS 132557 / TC161) TaxID=1328760 RepID=A0A165I647_XYLHT|nr:CGI-121-domain-containing protein [Xylona heveae TC161]KZF24440.1 CGI-121-domain-containing protein [Xylona heveae TC161]